MYYWRFLNIFQVILDDLQCNCEIEYQGIKENMFQSIHI